MLTQNERDQLGLKITEVAFLYSYDLPKHNAIKFIDILIKYIPDTFDRYMMAIDKYVQEPKNKIFPSPMNLKNYLSDELSDDAKANEIASRIRLAISNYGWSEPNKAKSFLGDAGWRVVDRFGGWQYLCENLGVTINTTAFYAQARESAKSIIEANYKGILDKPIYLENKKQLNQLTSIIKEIPKSKSDSNNISYIPTKEFNTDGEEEVLNQIDKFNGGQN